jgi:MFS family permease
MQSVAQQWIIYQMTGSKFLLGAVTFANAVPTLVFMLPSGVLADRVSRRKILIFTQIAMMACAFAFMALLAFQVLQEWHIFLLAILLGIASAVDAPARQSLTVEMVDDRRDLMNAIALNSSMFNAARVIGPAVAGWVLVQWGAVWCFGLNGISFLAVIIGLLLMQIQPAPVVAHGEPLRETVEGLRFARNHPVILPLILLAGISALFGFAYSALLPVYAVDVLNVGGGGFGLMNAAVGVGALLGSLIVASWTSDFFRGKLLLAGSLCFPAALIAFAFSQLFPLSLFFLVCAGSFFVAQVASINTIIQSIVSDEMRGRVMGIYMMVFFGATSFGALMAGALAESLGPVAAVAITASAALVGTALIYVSSPALRSLTQNSHPGNP